MPHINSLRIRFTAVAALLNAVLMLSALSISISAAHAAGPTVPGQGTVSAPVGSPTVPGKGTVTSPIGGPTVPGQGTVTNPTDAESGVLANPLKFKTLNELLSGVLKAAIEVGSIILTLALVLVGFRFVAARGNDEKIRSARTALMWTVIGGLILLGATAIQAVITSTVGSITAS